jgi:hypothetical protein
MASIPASNYVVQCNGGGKVLYFVNNARCATEPNAATRFRSAADASEIADACNQTGQCGGGCTVYQLSQTLSKAVHKKSGIAFTEVSHVITKHRK